MTIEKSFQSGLSDLRESSRRRSALIVNRPDSSSFSRAYGEEALFLGQVENH